MFLLLGQALGQEKSEEMAKRIQQLEKENAELRAEVERLQQGVSLSYDVRQAPVRPQRTVNTNLPPMTVEQAQLLAEVNRLRGSSPRTPPTAVPPTALTPAQSNLLAEARQLQRDEAPRRAEQRALYEEELALGQKYYDFILKQFESGRSTLEEVSRARRQLFALKREGLDRSRPQLKEIVREEIESVSGLLKSAKKRIEVGTAPPGHELDLERELLKLKRELLTLE